MRRVGSFTTPNKLLRPIIASPSGDLFAATEGTRLFVWSGADWEAPPRKVLNTNVKHFTGFAFHPSGRYLAATSNDASVKLYDTTTWTVLQAFDWQIGRLRSVAFSHDGMLAAAGSDKGKIIVWDVDL
jgi:WD40 repeat protein